MFKSARWRSEKNKVKVVFKLQFHAAKVPHFGEDALMISVVPADVGKPTVKSDKASVREGSCIWDNPVYESVKFNRDPKSGKIHERIYYFVVGTGSSKAGVLGEASIDFSNYAESTKVSLMSLPLKNSNTDAVLNVSIQRMQESVDQREVEEIENTKLNYKVNSLKSQLDNGDKDETVESNSDDVQLSKTVSHITEFNGTRQGSSGSDLTISSLDSSSGVEIPWQPQLKPESVHQEPIRLASSLTSQVPNADAQLVVYEEQQRSQWEWLGNSCHEASTDDSSSTPRDAFPRQHLDESSDIVIEKLRSEVAALSRQSEMSELELQTLRKQIVKESKRGQDLFRELVCLKEERDVLKGQCDKLKASQSRNNLQFEGGDSKAIVEELRQELNHAKEFNANLRVQLQKTQESNSELILAVRDLDELLEQKNREILSISSGKMTNDINEKLQEAGPTHETDDESDDEDQKALEELVKDHGDTKEAYLLEQQIIDMRSEIEIYKRDRDEFEMQMEQLALDYEIMKQENHEMAYKLEQSEIQEQLKMQYECTSSYASAQELETQIENLENELKRQSKESADAFVKISELEAHVKSLEEDLEKQSQGFEADLDALMRSKVEQEQRAIRAEETLRKTRWKNANTAERLQDEFKRLSVQMGSTFEANEKLATKALAEANELRIEKRRLEEMIRIASEEFQSEKDHYEDRLHQLSSQIEQMQSEVEDKSMQILSLKKEVETCTSKNKEDLSSKETFVIELEQMRNSIKEMELLVEQGNDERMELENRYTSLKSDAEESQKELNKMGSLLEEKELVIESLQSELDCLQSQYTDMKHRLVDNELENEELRKQVGVLNGDLKKTEDALGSMEKKMKDDTSGLGRTLDAVRSSSKEVANLKERIKSLEGQIEFKESALDTSSNAFLEKEKDLHNKIEELRGRLEKLNHCYENEVEKVGTLLTEEARKTEEVPSNPNSDDIEGCTNNDVLRNEMTLLKEKNTLMEAELKEMQERYSEISLKFAEVEGERQQLVMKVRNLKNKRKS